MKSSEYRHMRQNCETCLRNFSHRLTTSHQPTEREPNMKAREGFREQQKCSACDVHREGYFCDFAGEAMTDFEAIKVTRIYPKDTMMFAQGQPANGVYIVCQGRAKVSIYSQDGKTVILRVVQPGDVLGLSATMSDRTHH